VLLRTAKNSGKENPEFRIKNKRIALEKHIWYVINLNALSIR